MSRRGYYKKRRERLMEKDPHCYWCPRKLKLYPNYPKKMRHQTMPEDYVTIDHLKSRFWGPRRDVGMKERTLVLACPKCNNRRQAEEKQKYIWITRWKSGSFPYPFRWVGKILKNLRKQNQI